MKKRYKLFIPKEMEKKIKIQFCDFVNEPVVIDTDMVKHFKNNLEKIKSSNLYNNIAFCERRSCCEDI